MTSQPASPAATIERLTDALALITAAQGLLRGQLRTEVFAEQVQRIGQQYSDPTDALTHMAMACAQVLRGACSAAPDEALSRTGMALASFELTHRTRPE